MKETLTERMRHAAAHCETLYDAEWEAQQLRDGAKEIERMKSEFDSLENDARRYNWLKTATKEQLLLWRGAWGCSDSPIDEAIGDVAAGIP